MKIFAAALSLSLLCIVGTVNSEPKNTETNNAQPKIEDYKLMVNGRPFIIKGMAYAPEPKGFPGNKISGKSEYGWEYKNGAWLCMPANQYNPNDWKSPCDDDDFFGTLKIESAANETYNKELQSKWERELDQMQNIGVNTLRLYNINSVGKDHIAFLDEVSKRNMYVIYPILTDYLSKQANYDKNKIVNSIKEVCGNKAILAFTAGNELPVFEDKATLARVNEVVDLIHQNCPGSLVTYAMADDPSKWAVSKEGETSELVEKIPNVDFITVNAGYRGDPSTNASHGYNELFFNQIQLTTEKYKKPFLIGEVGKHLNDKYGPTWFNAVLKIILNRSTEAHNLGLVFFEYNDEPIKKSAAGTSNDITMGITKAGVLQPGTESTVQDPANEQKTDFQMFTGSDCNFLNCNSQ
ncbi:hypothetical protein [Legionella waltersii]|nr:hypothetical protein [Legionella waltersii]